MASLGCTTDNKANHCEYHILPDAHGHDMTIWIIWRYRVSPWIPRQKKHTEITNYNCDNNTKLLFGSHNYKSVFRKYVLPSILDKPVLSRYSVIVDVYITVFGSQLLSRGLLWNQITKTHIWSPGKLIIPVKASWSRNQRRCEIYGQRNVLSLWQFL